jgi:nucleoid-associated protein Lsr2
MRSGTVAKEVFERITDDLDGSEDAQTVRIGWQGEWREIDLGEKNLSALSRGFDRFWEAARPVRTSNGSGRRTRRSTNGRDPRAIRVWAEENGIRVPARGRIPGNIEDQYNAAVGR